MNKTAIDDRYGARLSQALLLGGLNATQLARALGCGKAAISKVVLGAGTLNARNSALAAQVLGVSHDWLALGVGEPRPPLLMERLALSAKAVYIGSLLDDMPPERVDAAYALIVQMLQFGGGHS